MKIKPEIPPCPEAWKPGIAQAAQDLADRIDAEALERCYAAVVKPPPSKS